MKSSEIKITIDKPLEEVFEFAITPPNSSKWIPGVTSETTSEWPVQIGTVYRLGSINGSSFEVSVSDIKTNSYVEWIKGTYHCRYKFKSVGDNQTQLIYHEWVDDGELDQPFPETTLYKLKQAIESAT